MIIFALNTLMGGEVLGVGGDSVGNCGEELFVLNLKVRCWVSLLGEGTDNMQDSAVNA